MWVPDHLAQVDPTVPAEADDMLEAYSVLAYLASRTERVRLGALVTNVALRPPALLANAVATLDTLSGGRAWLGIGAGYDTSETADLGVPTLPTGERFELLEETVRVVTQMFAGDATPITGAHVRLDRPFLRPRPVKGIPLLIGGTGERRRCGWSPSMPMPATCSTCPTTARQCGTSSTSWPGTASRWAGRETRSRRR